LRFLPAGAARDAAPKGGHVKKLLVVAALVLAALAAAPQDASAGASRKGASAAAAAVAAGPVDVNAASAEELDSLPGIGPALAKRIIDYRQEHGPFAKVDDLLAVKGVGPKMLAKIRDRLTIGAPKEKAK